MPVKVGIFPESDQIGIRSHRDRFQGEHVGPVPFLAEVPGLPHQFPPTVVDEHVIAFEFDTFSLRVEIIIRAIDAGREGIGHVCRRPRSG